jgi:hypothetical protein
MESNFLSRRNRVPKTLFALFLGALLLDVGGALYIKYAISLIVFLYLGFRFCTGTLYLNKSIVFELSVFVFLPLASALLSVAVFEIPPSDAVSGILPFATFAAYPLFLLINKVSLITIFSNAMVIAACLVIGTAMMLLILHEFRYDDLIARINTLADELRIGYIGANPNFDFFVPNVYYRWTVLLVPAAIILSNGSLTKQFLVLIAAFLSLSTAVIVFSVLGIIIGQLLNRQNQPNRTTLHLRTALVITVPLLCLMAIDYAAEIGLANFIGSKFFVEAGGNEQRLGHISSIIDLVMGDEITLLLGMGVGSSFFSTGVNAEVVNVEVSHLNLIRQFGLLYGLLFFGYVFAVIWGLLKSDQVGRKLGIALTMLFLAAGTNPLLLSPVFFTFLLMCRAYLSTFARTAGTAAPINTSYA